MKEKSVPTTPDKQAKPTKTIDPNGPAVEGRLFGLPYEISESDIVLIPAPWEVTVSYRAGTAKGPEAILEASLQVDLARRQFKDAWKVGIAMLPISKEVRKMSDKKRKLAEQHIRQLSKGKKTSKKIPADIDAASLWLNDYIDQTASKWLKKNKIVGLVGGDHSTPLGLFSALGKKHKSFSILQIDAHFDLRKDYEGFAYSHASIMHNALEQIPAIEKLVQVGIRDYCEEELDRAASAKSRIKTFFDDDLKAHLMSGVFWEETCEKIVAQLGDHVHISFDIDGLDPKLCPHTGTPVPGGLEFDQIVQLLATIVEAKKRIIGFDLVEVSPGKNEWDANVGARVLRELYLWTAASQGILKYPST